MTPGIQETSLQESQRRSGCASNGDFPAFFVCGGPHISWSRFALHRCRLSTLEVNLIVLKASTEDEFDSMFNTARAAEAGGLVFSSDPYFAYRSEQLAALGGRRGVPAITQSRDFPLAGGLMRYGGDFHQSHRNTGM